MLSGRRGGEVLTHARVMLLPGLDGTGRLFAPFIECLPKGFDVDIVDYPRDRVLDLNALVSLVEDRMEPGVRHVVLAESFSGPIGILCALRRQEDVAAVVLCASFVRNPLPRVLRWLPRLANRAVLAMPPPGLVVRALLLDFRTPAGEIGKVQAAVREVRAGVLAARVRSLSSVDVTEDIGRLEMPVLYLQATDDRLVGARGAQQVRRALPRAEVRLLKAPHLVLQARPRESANAIIEFLNANEAR